MSGRRGNNEGTIVKRADGRWETRISLSNGTRKSYYGKTRQEVQRKLAQAQRDVMSGLPIVGDRQTLGHQYLQSWLETAQQQLKASTHRRYRTSIQCHILPALGDVPLSKLTPQHVQDFYTSKLKSGLSPETVMNMHTVVHGSLKAAARMGLVQRNVADVVQKPCKRRKEFQTFTEEQVQIFLRTARGNRLEAMYILAVTTGMRVGELLGLTWGDVDLERGILQVVHSLQETAAGPSKWGLTQPKTAHSRRRIALSQTAINALVQHRQRQEVECLQCRQLWDPSYNLVFPKTIGKPLHISHLRRREYWPLLQRAGLPRIRFHDLRHTAATLLLRRGVTPKIVSEMLGHANIAITLDIYSHVTPDMQAAAANIMDELLSDGHDK